MGDTILEKQKFRILFLASDPSDASKIHLGKELQEVRNKLADNANFELKDQLAVKPEDVLQIISNYKPHIVHFSGHGLNTGELCFEDVHGKVMAISPEALASLFGLVSEFVKCVIVNTCYSERQAKAISQYVPVVIGTKKEISDNAAIKFSTGFYTALEPDLNQKNLEMAFKRGLIAIQFDGNIQEHLTPILIFGSAEVRFFSEVETAFSSFTHTQGPAINALIRGLSLIGKKMGLAEENVNKIISDKIYKLQAYSLNLQEYEESLRDILKDEFPLSDLSLIALSQLQKGLNLSDQDVESIRRKIMSDQKMDSAYSWYDRGRNQDTIQNYDKAIEYYTKAIQKNTDYSAAYYERGYTYDKMLKFDLALPDLTHAIEINKNWEVENNLSSAYLTRGHCYYSIMPQTNENMVQALNDWSKSIELNPNEPTAFSNRGLANQYLRYFDKAIADYKKSLKIDNSTNNKIKASRVANIVKCYQELGQSEEIDKWTKIGLDLLKPVGDSVDSTVMMDAIGN
jgi:tetratricopeptide (TPR) repeat protein